MRCVNKIHLSLCVYSIYMYLVVYIKRSQRIATEAILIFFGDSKICDRAREEIDDNDE